jgi:hypothetical protein
MYEYIKENHLVSGGFLKLLKVVLLPVPVMRPPHLGDAQTNSTPVDHLLGFGEFGLVLGLSLQLLGLGQSGFDIARY